MPRLFRVLGSTSQERRDVRVCLSRITHGLKLKNVFVYRGASSSYGCRSFTWITRCPQKIKEDFLGKLPARNNQNGLRTRRPVAPIRVNPGTAGVRYPGKPVGAGVRWGVIRVPGQLTSGVRPFPPPPPPARATPWWSTTRWRWSRDRWMETGQRGVLSADPLFPRKGSGLKLTSGD